MGTSTLAVAMLFRRSLRAAVPARTRTPGDTALRTELSASLHREKALLRELTVRTEQQDLLAQEFAHRLGNGLQMIVALLSLQSRASATPETAAQLTIAASRVAAFSRVHQRLHLRDGNENVDFKPHLQRLCSDLSELMLQKNAARSVIVMGTNIALPRALAVSLGLLVTEAVTNSVKYADGDITVEIEALSDAISLSITDDGPGLPAGFEVTRGKGLGTRLIRGLATQAGGAVEFGPGDDGHGTRVTVVFKPGAGAWRVIDAA